MTEREDLINNLKHLEIKTPDGMLLKTLGQVSKNWHLEHIADFILAERKRIVQPLIWSKKCRREIEILEHYIDQTLKRAGIQ